MFKETRASGRNRQKNSLKDCVFVNLALKKYTQKKIHSYRLLFRRFCPLKSISSRWKESNEFTMSVFNFCCLSRLTIGKKLILAKYSILTNDERCKNCDILNYINRNCQQLIWFTAIWPCEITRFTSTVCIRPEFESQ